MDTGSILQLLLDWKGCGRDGDRVTGLGLTKRFEDRGSARSREQASDMALEFKGCTTHTIFAPSFSHNVSRSLCVVCPVGLLERVLLLSGFFLVLTSLCPCHPSRSA